MNKESLLFIHLHILFLLLSNCSCS